MQPLAIIDKYYAKGSKAYQILTAHGRVGAEKALAIAERFAHLKPDNKLIAEASLLHDIGIFMTDAHSLGCRGSRPYICHGVLGREILEKHALPKHALICERHMGAGITKDEILQYGYPLPLRDMMPISIEERIICYADKFFSKNGDHPHTEKSVQTVTAELGKYSRQQADKFKAWHARFQRYQL